MSSWGQQNQRFSRNFHLLSMFMVGNKLLQKPQIYYYNIICPVILSEGIN